jgi:hypothetical protein
MNNRLYCSCSERIRYAHTSYYIHTHQQFRQAIETEMQAHWSRVKQVLSTGEQLLSSTPTASTKDEIKERMKSLQTSWDQLKEICIVLANM